MILATFMEVVSSILQKHYICLFKTNISIEILSSYNVDTVLKYVRAFMRARGDQTLIKKGFMPVVYEQDDYSGESSEKQP